jgi:hypothetical protein
MREETRDAVAGVHFYGVFTENGDEGVMRRGREFYGVRAVSL